MPLAQFLADCLFFFFNFYCYSILGRLSVTFPTTYKQIGPFWCWFLGGCFCLFSRSLWVSPVNSPVSLGVSPVSSTPTGFISQRFWGFISLHWNPGLCDLSSSLVVPPSLSACKCATTPSTSCPLTHRGPLAATLLPISAPPTSLDECFFFNSLVVRLPYSSIFWQFWLFCVSKFLVLLLVVQGGKVYLTSPPSYLEVHLLLTLDLFPLIEPLVVTLSPLGLPRIISPSQDL